MNSKGAFALRKMPPFGARNRRAMPDTRTQMLTRVGRISSSVSSEKSSPVEAVRVVYQVRSYFLFQHEPSGCAVLFLGTIPQEEQVLIC